MQLKKALLSILFCSTTLVAQNVYDVYPERVMRTGEMPVDSVKRILTGFTGGMKLHVGYVFASSADDLFRNSSLQQMSSLPNDGVTMGLGGELRLHLIDHIHIGIDGGMSAMPLQQSGSSIRTGWGGVLCDYYGTVGKVKLYAGGEIGGGSTKRLYVPMNAETVTGSQDVVYNASYTTTPYFLLDPYVGMEIMLNRRISLMIQIDYMLPLGSDTDGLRTEAVRWSRLLSPSGPRLYIGLMFGKHVRQPKR